MLCPAPGPASVGRAPREVRSAKSSSRGPAPRVSARAPQGRASPACLAPSPDAFARGPWPVCEGRARAPASGARESQGRPRAVQGERQEAPQEPPGEVASTSARPGPSEARLLLQRGPWGVRPAAFAELRSVAAVQARVFHEPGPVAALDAFFLTLFQAEVYDVLKSKAQRNSPNKYTCLIATPCDPPRQEQPSAGEASSQGGTEPCAQAQAGQGNGGVPPIVGVVDATCAEEASVLRHLPEGITSYLYLTGMAVDPDYRRERVGSLLLESAEARALSLGLDYVVLHVHDDNVSALRFYQQAGFSTVSRDPWWASVLLAMKPRLLMAKKLTALQGA